MDSPLGLVQDVGRPCLTGRCPLPTLPPGDDTPTVAARCTIWIALDQPRDTIRAYHCPMLIRFDSKVGTFVALGDTGVELIRMTGHSGDVPGAILGADTGAALRRLKAALAAMPSQPRDEDDEEDNDRPKREPAVTLRQRAWPLIDLLERSAKKGCDVVWSVEPPDSLRV